MKRWILAVCLAAAPLFAQAVEVTPKIIGGDPVSTGYEFYAALLVEGTLSGSSADVFWFHFCGASYLGDGIVLTAAHCVESVKRGGQFAVLLGNHSSEYRYVHCPSSGICTRSNSIAPPSGSEFSGFIALDGLPASGFVLNRDVRTVAVHPEYNSSTVRNDVALIRLPVNVFHESITLTTRAQSTFLANARVIGHGDTRVRVAGEAGDITPEPDIVLQAVDVPTVSDSLCSTEYRNKTGESGLIHGPSMLCAGFPDGVDGSNQKDSCQGDSGGPLIYGSGSAGDEFQQIGVVSWGLGCAKTYGVYSDIKELRSWIVSKMNEDIWRSKNGGGALSLWALVIAIPLMVVRWGRSIVVLIAVLGMAGCASFPTAAGDPEVLFNPEVTDDGLAFSVVSHGCTEDKHLFLRVEGSSLTLLRTQKDMCRTAPQLLRFVMPLPVADNVWQIENPVRYSNRLGRGGESQ